MKMMLTKELNKIPGQLCDKRFGFVKLNKNSKRPFERNWQKRPYSLQQIKPWISQGYNYGVLGGHGGLVIIDTDTDEMTKAVEASLSPTFTVKTPKNGYHFYFFCEDIKKKIVLQRNGAHHGEIISHGSQVVGAGSFHPETKTQYEVYRDLPIVSVTQAQVLSSLKDYIDIKRKTQNKQDCHIDITRILDVNGIKTRKNGSQLICGHPVHGSETGTNLVIDPHKNVWHCFRCQSGGDPLLLIAVIERIISCDQARAGTLRGELFKETLRVAQQKYGLDVSRIPKSQAETGNEFEGFFNDNWNARQFVQQHGSKLKNCDNLGGWHVWNGKVWELDEIHNVMRMARETVNSFYDLANSMTDEDLLKLFLKHIKSSGNETKLKSMTNLARSFEDVSVKSSQFDSEDYLLNCLNGMMDLKSGKLVSHSSDMLVSKMCGTHYDQDAVCPEWLKFLDTIFHGNSELIRFVQKAIGYTLTGDVSYQAFFILHGAGANGKSTFVDTIYKMLGSYAVITPTSTLTTKRGNEIPNDIARLKGARFVIASELSRSKALDEALIKQLTSTEPISARYLHKEFFEFRPTGKVFLSTNYKPTIRGTDDGIWRRIKLIPFEHKFEGKNKIENYAEKYLFAELPGILRWAVDGYHGLQKEGFQEPEIVVAATHQYQASEDIIGSFLNECCVLQPRCMVKVSELYDLYKQTSDVHVRKKDFNDYLLKSGYKKDRGTTGNFKGRFYWQGIGIKDLLNGNEECSEGCNERFC